MNLALNIARRYLFSKKSTNAINIISMISALGLMIGTIALLLVLSVFNGFEDLVTSLYHSFNPDIIVTAKKGKVFSLEESTFQELTELKGITAISRVLEENALVQYKDKDEIARLKGVDEYYTSVTRLDSAIVEGKYMVDDKRYDHAVIGAVLRDQLGMNLFNDFVKLSVYLPRRDIKASKVKPENAFKQATLYPTGTFSIQQDFDSKFVIVPISFMRNLLSYETECSALEFALEDYSQQAQIIKQLKEKLGPDYDIKNRYQQDEFLYKVMRTEKWAVYLILTFILIVASFNVIGSLSMLVIEKHHDIGILKAMGGTPNFIRNVFLIEGILLAFVAGTSGIAIATIICLSQKHFQLLKLAGNSFLIEAYPVSMRLSDFVLVFVTVMTIGFIAAWFPAQRAAQQSQLLQGD